MFQHSFVKFTLSEVDILPTKTTFQQVSGLKFAVKLGLVTLAWLGINVKNVIAQNPPNIIKTDISQNAIAQAKVLVVNPNTGNDQRGDGSNGTPFKTITKALQVAEPNTVIMLSPGKYSDQTGERFPIILKPGVSLQGNTSEQGKGIIIAGGGVFLSRSFGGQNVAVVGANQSSIKGITVTNSNLRGYGLWVEYSNTVVSENTFTGNTQDGVAVSGNGSPSISKNYFYQNGANGITISGNSRPEVRENLFQQTGYGINIAQNAMPVIVGNQITGNRSGIIVQANAQPILRQNSIQNHQEDGLVIIAQAVPDLGKPNDPGLNEFRNNRRFDINAKAAKQSIAAIGNNLSRNAIAGNVNLQSTTTTIARVPLPSSLTGNTKNNNLPPLPQNPQQLNSVQMSSGAIEFTAPQISNPRTPQRPVTISGQRYRVYVPITNNQHREIVLSIVPDAFNTTWRGRRVMQVGIFNSPENANEIVQQLTSNGLKPIVVPAN